MAIEPKRGDIVIAATGSGFGGKPHPFVVLQSDTYPTSTIILAGCSTMVASEPALRPLLEPTTSNGLTQPCRVMVDILVTSPRAKIHRIAGRLSATQIDEVDTALLVVLGLAAAR